MVGGRPGEWEESGDGTNSDYQHVRALGELGRAWLEDHRDADA